MATAPSAPMGLVGGQAREPSRGSRVSKAQGQEAHICKMAQARTEELEPELKCSS